MQLGIFLKRGNVDLLKFKSWTHINGMESVIPLDFSAAETQFFADSYVLRSRYNPHEFLWICENSISLLNFTPYFHLDFSISGFRKFREQNSEAENNEQEEVVEPVPIPEPKRVQEQRTRQPNLRQKRNVARF